MSETDERFKLSLAKSLETAQDVKVTVDNEHTKALEKRALEAEEERDDLKNKLGIIAEKKLEEKRKSITDKINSTFKDSAKRTAMIEKMQQADPSQLSAMDSMLDAFQEQGKKSSQSFEPSGSAPLNQAQMQGSQGNNETDLAKIRFNNIEDAIRRLREEKAKGNPQAEPLLSALFKKGFQSYVNSGHPNSTYCEDDKIQKTSGDPTVNFAEYKASDFSELKRFGIKNAIPNYKEKTNPDGTPKER